MKSRQFDLGTYRVHFQEAASVLALLLADRRPSKWFILADRHTLVHCLPRLRAVSQPSGVIEIDPGEEQKTLATCEYIWRQLFDLMADRNSLLVNLGGGVIGDMGGFCASTYMRGIDFVQIPTTLLAQVDASVGGKLGIDFYGLKNAIGLFRDPLAVLADVDFLSTLPQRELRSGYAEIVKHALIADADMWSQLVGHGVWSTLPWHEILPASVSVKVDVVRQDPLERGLRKILNFGHTIGHAIESVMLELGSPVLHGEAIAAGMVAEAYLSEQIAGLSSAQGYEIADYLLAVYGKISLDQISPQMLLSKMTLDKKNTNDQIKFALLAEIGLAGPEYVASTQQIEAAIDFYRRL